MSNHPLGKRNTTPEGVQLMEQLVERSNMKRAYAQVMRNKGAAGIDNMSVDSLMPYLREKWPEIKGRILKGEYQPKPVKKVEIPKPDGERQLEFRY
jgi:RNA-directed DNA polymerase